MEMFLSHHDPSNLPRRFLLSYPHLHVVGGPPKQIFSVDGRGLGPVEFIELTMCNNNNTMTVKDRVAAFKRLLDP